MGIVMKAVYMFLYIFVNDRMNSNVSNPFGELGFARQFAVENQVSSFEVSALLGQLFDRIAPITQNTLVTIDIGDLALARCGVHKTRIIADQSIIFGNFNLKQIGGLDRAILNRDIIFFAGSIIDDRQSV